MGADEALLAYVDLDFGTAARFTGEHLGGESEDSTALDLLGLAAMGLARLEAGLIDDLLGLLDRLVLDRLRLRDDAASGGTLEVRFHDTFTV